jgi:hypothetical protein
VADDERAALDREALERLAEDAAAAATHHDLFAHGRALELPPGVAQGDDEHARLLPDVAGLRLLRVVREGEREVGAAVAV